MEISNSLTKPSGYQTFGVLLGGYLAVFAFADAKYERSVQSHNIWLSTFFSLAATDNPENFRIALSRLQNYERQLPLQEPKVLNPLTWWQPGYKRDGWVYSWLQLRTEFCVMETCSGVPEWRIYAPNIRFTFPFVGNFDNAFLREVNLYDRGLSASVNFSDLQYADLRQSNGIVAAEGASFKFAWMTDANFGGYGDNEGTYRSNFRNANLAAVQAACANFSMSDLSGASFFDESAVDVRDSVPPRRSEALLIFASFDNALLSETDFRSSDLRGASFSGARGLETASFEGARVLHDSRLATMFPDIVIVEDDSGLPTGEYCDR
ncbi:MAG: pentapeptide repeat-containing protein [Pseudomonadota bacterium]